MAWLHYGVFLTDSGDLPKAKEAFQRVIALNPNEEYPYRALVALHRGDDDWKSLISTLKQGASRFESLGTELIVALVASTDRRYRDNVRALELAEEFTKQYPDNPSYYLHLATAMFLNKKAKGVTEILEKARALGADAPCLSALRAIDLILRKERDLATQELANFTSTLKSSTESLLRPVLSSILENMVKKKTQ